jgi:serine/threonine-protein kinase RsbW
MLTLTVPARIDRLEGVVEAISACGREYGLPADQVYHLALATEEAFVNICKYSYPESHGEVELMCKPEGDRFVMEIADSGIPFDITALPDPDVTAGISERKIGGLGIFLIKKMTDEVKYHREGDKNVLRIVLKGM